MHTLALSSEADTLDLGQRLALQARKGDVITLSGPLGAGKSVLARGFLRQLAGMDLAVTSPTFTLVHVYDQLNPPVWHFDLYRLESADECAELGLDEAQATGISLIEWPQIGEPWLPRDRLDIELSLTQGDGRTAAVSPGPGWVTRIEEAVADDS